MDIFIELSIILIITTAIATLFRLIKQPLIVGYMVSGIVVGPYVFNILQSNEQVELFSK
jgi:Kef-type K+ transport system membrane component KefB